MADSVDDDDGEFAAVVCGKGAGEDGEDGEDDDDGEFKGAGEDGDCR